MAATTRHPLPGWDETSLDESDRDIPPGRTFAKPAEVTKTTIVSNERAVRGQRSGIPNGRIGV